MKDFMLSMAPTVVGFGKCNLEKRIIAIMSFKKPTAFNTALSTVLSALLVLGGCTTAAFAVAPLIEEPDTVSEPDLTVTVSEPAVTTSEPSVAASEPVSESNVADNNSETGEPEPIDLEDALESKYPRGEHSIPIFPEDKNGIYYSESGDVIRVPVHLLDVREQMVSNFGTKIVKNDKGAIYVHAVLERELPREHDYEIYFGDEFAVLTRNESIWREQIAIYRQMQEDGIIPYKRECFHDLNLLD